MLVGWRLKVLQYELIALEDASHIIIAVDEFNNEEKTKKIKFFNFDILT